MKTHTPISRRSTKPLHFIDLFAGAGGLSEGFIRAGYQPIAHVEMDVAACFSLKTRHAYHWLKSQNRLHIYDDYLRQKISRSEFYSSVPAHIIDSVINRSIEKKTLPSIIKKIDQLLGDQRLDLIVGGPPCQAYSLVGRSRDSNRMRGDERNYLFIHYAKFLRRYKPRYFVFENVVGLLSAKTDKGIRYLDQMLKLFKSCGYEVEYKVLSAEDFDVPQHRKRIILIGRFGSRTGFYPEFPVQRTGITIRNLLSDLPKLQAGEGSLGAIRTKKRCCSYLYDSMIRDDELPVTLHSARPHRPPDLDIYRIAVEKWDSDRERLNYNSLPPHLKTHRNRNAFLDRFKVVAGELPASHTVVAHIAKDGHYYIHFDVNQNRSLTPREAARIQTFPDNYFFESISSQAGRTAAFRQIGNAVPIRMSEIVANRLKEAWL